MWSLLLLLFLVPPDLVAQQGDRLILRDGENPCEGYIEVFHDNEWGIVGSNKWRPENSEVVCKSIGCGAAIETVNILKPQNDLPALLDDVVCDGTEDQLWNCNCCWESKTSRGRVYLKDTVKWITCSDKIDFKLDDFPCAGAIQYTKRSDGITTEGYVCLDRDAKDEAQRVCNMLNCGNLTEISPPEMMTPRSAALETKKLKCTGTEQHLWQCAVRDTCKNPTYIKCQKHRNLRLQGGDNLCAGNLEMEFKERNDTWEKVSCENITADLWCRQMHCGTPVNHSCAEGQVSLNCSDTVNVTLVHNKEPNQCHGEVHIGVNGVLHPVCDSDWDENDGKVVCRERGCGKLIYVKKSTKPQRPAILDNVKCTGNETSLWHCNAKYNSKGVSCVSTAYVVCAESLQVKLVDGPGKCAGRLEIKHEGQWQQVDETGWEDHYYDTVCRHLGCGKARNSTMEEKFSLSSSTEKTFLDQVVCTPGADKIWDCVTSQTKLQEKKQATAKTIICENHKVLFLRGSRSCSGTVGIEKGDISYWLSGSNKTWTREMADMVCRQMHCGTATDVTSISHNDNTENLGIKTYQCNSTHENLFDCVENEGPSNDSIAHVTCSSETTVALTNQCWGEVNVTVEGKSGGVCADTWSNRMFEMLCENPKKCGSKIVEVDPPDSKRKMIIKSFHTTKHTKRLYESNLVLSDNSDFHCVKKQVYVVCSGSVKTKFSDSRDHCSGNLMMTIENQERLVCEEALKDTNVQNVICRQLGCGKADAVLSFFGPIPGGNKRVTEITCDASSKSLAKCSMKSKSSTCTPVGLKCSGWQRMEMKLEDKACKGDVFVRSAAGLAGVSSEGWTEKEGKMLCENLGCGSYRNFLSTNVKTSTLTAFNCTDAKGEKRNIWECQQKKTGNKQLSVTCDGEPQVALSKGCSGEVLINGRKVCNRQWNINYSQIVCKQLECGNAHNVTVASGSTEVPVPDLTHVSCLEHEDTLGQCKTVTGECSGQPVSVYCDDAVELRTTETCGGQIRLLHRGQLESVCPLNQNFDLSDFEDILCQKLNCGSGLDKKVTKHYGDQYTNKLDMKMSLIYTRGPQDLKCYIDEVPCKNRKPAEIYCEDYIPPPERPVGSPVKLIVGVSLGAFFLILVILLVFVLQRRFARKVRPKYSADIEDLEDAEMPERRRLSDRGSERAVVKEYDTRSASSVYDDIDEGDETAYSPLRMGQQPDAAEPGANNNAPGQSAEDITYEVDMAADGYDDIGVEGEVEVHDVPNTKPENSRELPPVPGEEDYMEPDLDRHLKLE
ncbi:scavenger receptor cysteine-rich type 1 protein M160 [Myripristis murdjan]|uniref:scavenger receptor cysteine-rich type 1 protein M160 n=1 Tax=Myripristis murdjan TaxID=586833 RepID=UPI0011760755|nr:scavenger receptor cysteine-rich type 1 protein M160-like [Myripristis murdjan]